MTEPVYRKLFGSIGRDPGCDAGLDVIDVYCEAVLRGAPVAELYADFITHIGNCTACREDTESLLATLRDLENLGAG